MSYKEIVFLFVALLASNGGEKVRYDGDAVLRVTPKTEVELLILTDILERYKTIDVWKTAGDINEPFDIQVPMAVLEDVTQELQDAGIQFVVLISDVQQLIEAEFRQRYIRAAGEFDYTVYHTLEEIHDWVDQMVAYNSDKATVFTAANSTEGRPLKGIKISSLDGEPNRPVFWIEGGIHAREWLSPAAVMYMAGKMLSEYNTDTDIKAMVDNYDWYILPVVNPDGYEYTWTDNRLWRKTRSAIPGSSCRGVDANRNWSKAWSNREGSGNIPCTDLYKGPSAFSEPETKGVSDFLKGLMQTKTVKGFIDYHSYGNYWVWPWGYTTRSVTPDHNLLKAGAAAAVNALSSVYGTPYASGAVAKRLYVISGSSLDWTYSEGITFSYVVEMRDNGRYGFLLSADQIVPTGEEHLLALKALAEFMVDK